MVEAVAVAKAEDPQKLQTDDYDVVIIGGGVCGTALLYTLSNYTNVGRIALIEKNAEVEIGRAHV